MTLEALFLWSILIISWKTTPALAFVFIGSAEPRNAVKQPLLLLWQHKRNDETPCGNFTKNSYWSDGTYPSFPRVIPTREYPSPRRRSLLVGTSTLFVPQILPAHANEPIEEPLECRNGVLVSETSVPGAYQQSCMMLPERKIPLKSTGDVLVMQQGASVGAGRTGVAVWNSALVLCRLLDALQQENPLFLKDKVVVELGCGPGLCSCAAATLGAAQVFATDGNPQVLMLARDNVQRNHLEQKVEVQSLQWGLLEALDYADVADVVIGSDLTYNSGAWRVLAETMSLLLKPNGIVLYLSLGHVNFSVDAEMNGFVSVAEQCGLQVVKDTAALWKRPPQQVLETSCLTSLSERAVVEATGGVRVLVLRKPPLPKFS